MRRWIQLDDAERATIAADFERAILSPDFRWPDFAYRHDVRVWSLRRVFDDAYRKQLGLRSAATRKEKRMKRRNLAALALHHVIDDTRTLTGQLLGDPLPGRSALDRPPTLDRAPVTLGGRV